MQDILSPATAAVFMKQRQELLGSRMAYVFDLAVEQGNSHWVLVGPTGRQYRPAYKGAIWIDRESRRVLRIEQIAQSDSAGMPYDKAESVVEYGFVNIEGKSYLLPCKARTWPVCGVLQTVSAMSSASRITGSSAPVPISSTTSSAPASSRPRLLHCYSGAGLAGLAANREHDRIGRSGSARRPALPKFTWITPDTMPGAAPAY